MRAFAQTVARFEALIIAPLILLTMRSSALIVPTLIIAALLWGIRWLATGRLSKATPIDLPLIGLLIMLGVSWFVSAYPALTQPQILRVLLGITLFYALINAAPMRWIAHGLTLAGLGLALVSPFVVDWFVGKFLFIPAELYRAFPRLVSDTINPNVMAGTLLILLPIPLSLLWNARLELAGWERALALVSATAMSVIIFISQSRTGLVGVAVMLFVLCVLRWRRARWLLISIALVGAILIPWNRVIESQRTQLSTGGPGALVIRELNWNRAIELIREKPITGIGMGTYPEYTDKGSRGVTGLKPIERIHAHNMILQLALDVGVPGLLMWLIAFVLIVGACLSGLSQSMLTWTADVNRNFRRACLMAVIAALFGALAHGMFDSVLWGPARTAPIFLWATYALAIKARLVD